MVRKQCLYLIHQRMKQVWMSSLGVNDAVAMLQTTKKAPSYKDGTGKAAGVFGACFEVNYI